MDKNINQDNRMSAGNFRTYASSATINSELKEAKDINSFLEKNKKNMIPHNLPMHLELLLDEKGIKKADVARDSQLDRKYVYQIFSGEKSLTG